jgi:hypothetical protein
VRHVHALGEEVRGDALVFELVHGLGQRVALLLVEFSLLLLLHGLELLQHVFQCRVVVDCLHVVSTLILIAIGVSWLWLHDGPVNAPLDHRVIRRVFFVCTMHMGTISQVHTAFGLAHVAVWLHVADSLPKVLFGFRRVDFVLCG